MTGAPGCAGDQNARVATPRIPTVGPSVTGLRPPCSDAAEVHPIDAGVGIGHFVRARRWGRALVRMWHKIWADRVLGMSAEAGFWGLVSLPSLLLAVFGALGYLGGSLGGGTLTRVHDDVLRVAGDVLSPATVRDDVAPLLSQVLQHGHAGVVSVSFVISLWSGSTATSAYLNTITVAYGMRGLRSAVRSRIVALGLYLLAVVAGIVVLPALILGPDAIVDLAPGSARHGVAGVVSLSYWPALVVVSVVVLATLYRLCLPVRVRWRAHIPGAVLAMLIWLAGSIVVRAYVEHETRGAVSYGALGAPLAALLFFYVTALAVLLGAELNAALRAERRPEPSAEDGRPQENGSILPLPSTE